MQIVIDIPEEMYRKYKMLDDNGITDKPIHYIAHGNPLPKGHGRLIDADALGQELHRYTTAPYQYALKVFEEATTIIEADKESD